MRVPLDCDELERWRRHLAGLGVRIAASLALGGYEAVQLHPRDTGGALLEINTTRGGSALHAAYGPAGPQWQRSVRTARVSGIVGAALQSEDPPVWPAAGARSQRPAVRDGDEWHLPLDNAVLRFVAATDGRGEGLVGIDVDAADGQAIVDAAVARGCGIDAGGIAVGGVRFRLRTTPEPR